MTDEEFRAALEAVREDNRRALAALEQRLLPLTTGEVLRATWYYFTRPITWPFRCLAQVWRYSSGVQRACIVSGGAVLAFLTFVLAGCSTPGENLVLSGSNLSGGSPPLVTVCGEPARVVSYGRTSVTVEAPASSCRAGGDVCVSTPRGESCSGRHL